MKKEEKINLRPDLSIDVTELLLKNGRSVSPEVIERFKERLPVTGEAGFRYKTNTLVPIDGLGKTSHVDFFQVSLENATHEIIGLDVSEGKDKTVRVVAKVKPLNTDFARKMFELHSEGKAQLGVRAIGALEGREFHITNIITFDLINKG